MPYVDVTQFETCANPCMITVHIPVEEIAFFSDAGMTFTNVHLKSGRIVHCCDSPRYVERWIEEALEERSNFSQ